MRLLKTTETRVALIETFVILYALAAGSTNSLDALASPAMILRLAVPGLAASLILLWRNLQSATAVRPLFAPLADIGLALASVLTVEAMLMLLRPELVLPRYQFTRGALIAWSFLGALRAWFPHALKASRMLEARTPLTIERLRWNAIQFEIKFRQWSSWANTVAAAAIGLLTLSLPFAGGTHVQLASGIFIAGGIYAVWVIRRRGSPGAAPLGGGLKEYKQYCQAELRQQSILLHRLWHWYFGSLIPGVFLLLQGATVYGCFILTYVLLLGELTYRAIHWIDIEIARIQLPHPAQTVQELTADCAD